MALFCYLRLYLGILKNCFLQSSVDTDDKDKHGFKIEKFGKRLMVCLEITKRVPMFSASSW